MINTKALNLSDFLFPHLSNASYLIKEKHANYSSLHYAHSQSECVCKLTQQRWRLICVCRHVAAGWGGTPAMRGEAGSRGSYRSCALAGAKMEGGGQSEGLGPRCWRKTGAGSQGKEGLLHESSCNGPLV